MGSNHEHEYSRYALCHACGYSYSVHHKKDLEDNKKTLPSAGKNEDCEVKNYKVKGNTVSWETVCKDGTKGSGEITYKGDSYAGTMKMETVDKKGQKSTINYKIKGQRKGDC